MVLLPGARCSTYNPSEEGCAKLQTGARLQIRNEFDAKQWYLSRTLSRHSSHRNSPPTPRHLPPIAGRDFPVRFGFRGPDELVTYPHAGMPPQAVDCRISNWSECWELRSPPRSHPKKLIGLTSPLLTLPPSFWYLLLHAATYSTAFFISQSRVWYDCGFELGHCRNCRNVQGA